MPTYSFRCCSGHEFDERVKLDLSDAPKSCEFPMPEGSPCGQPVERTLTAPSGSFPGADSWRKR